jgi:hypothetical protein
VAAVLFPVLEGLYADADQVGELGLGEAGSLADEADSGTSITVFREGSFLPRSITPASRKLPNRSSNISFFIAELFLLRAAISAPSGHGSVVG